MKYKYLLLLLVLASLPRTVLAVPSAWDFANSILQPLFSQRGAEIKGSFFTATSTSNNTFPNLVSTNSTTTNATTTNFTVFGSILAPFYTATSTTATSTFAGAVQIGSTAADNRLRITAERNYPTAASTGGMVSLFNTNNISAALNVYSNAGAGQSSLGLVFMKQDNALSDGSILRMDNDGLDNALIINQNETTSALGPVTITNAAMAPGIQINQTNTSNSQGAIRIDSAAPEIEMVETDQTSPAGKYEFRVQNDKWQVNSRNSADDSFERILSLTALREGGALALLHPTFGGYPSQTSRFDIIGLNTATTTQGYFSVSSETTPAGGEGVPLNDIFTINTTGLVGISTSSPFGKLSVQLIGTDTTRFPFYIASSTAAFATTTLFYVDNTGTASTSKLFADGLVACDPTTGKLLWSGGVFSCGTDQTAAGAGNSKFATGTTNYIFPNGGAETDVLIGHTATTTTSKLEVHGTTNSNNFVASTTATSTLPRLFSSIASSTDFFFDNARGSSRLQMGKTGATGVRVDVITNADFTQGFRTESDLTTRLGFSSFVTGDSFVRFTQRIDGLLGWGPGSATTDTNLYRSAENELKTDDNLIIAGNSTTTNATSTNSYVSSWLTALFGNITDLIATRSTTTNATTTTLHIADGWSSTLGQGWLNTNGVKITSSTSPTINYVVATSTTKNSTFASNVGVGTTTPSQRIVIDNGSTRGNISLGETAAGNPFVFINNTLSAASLGSGIRFQKNYVNQFGFGVDYAGDGTRDWWVYDYVAALPRLLVNSSGFLGIGSTTPARLLSVHGSAYVSSGLFVGGNIVSTSTVASIIPYASSTAQTITSELDVSDAIVKQKFYPSFTYSTSTTWTGTTTIPLGPAFTIETWNQVKCFTDTGTLNVAFNDATNKMNMLQASTTVGTFGFSTNNTFTASEKRYVDIGTPATSPKSISCTVNKTINE